MAATEVRTQIYLPKRLHERLRGAARRRGVSMAQLLREGAEVVLHRELEDGPLDDLIGAVGGGPADLAEEHDRYLYAPPERLRKRAAKHPRARLR